MLDVSFVLVMMFLLLSTLARTTSQDASERSRTSPVPISAPDMDRDTADGVGLTDVEGPIITIDQDGAYTIDGRTASLEQVRSHLEATRPPIVDIRPDVRAAVGRLTELLSLCHGYGLTPSIGYTVAESSP